MKWFEPNQFDWDENPPLSSFTAVVVTSVFYIFFVLLSNYLSQILIGKKDVYSGSKGGSKRTALKWNPWFNSDLQNAQTAHNIILVVSSALMFCGTIYESKRRMNQDGNVIFLFCENEKIATKGPLYYWSYMYYISKYYELLDTFLQLARGKPPPNFGLHVYHHAVVLFMAWMWCSKAQSLQFIGLLFNTFVHVIMYSYFLQRTLTGQVPRWKNLVTRLQIIQFAFSMLAFLVTLYLYWFQNQQCSGMNALYFNVFFNITLLQSFMKILSKGKKKKPEMLKV